MCVFIISLNWGRGCWFWASSVYLIFNFFYTKVLLSAFIWVTLFSFTSLFKKVIESVQLICLFCNNTRIIISNLIEIWYHGVFFLFSNKMIDNAYKYMGILKQNFNQIKYSYILWEMIENSTDYKKIENQLDRSI